jgi:ATP-dependent DNA helicase RecG
VKGSEKSSEKGTEKSSEKILGVIRRNRRISAREIGEMVGISPRAVEKLISKLKREDRLKRVGPDRGGYWEIVEDK